ncbi:response regulator [Kiloniella sp. b19]|uniref:response regulator n=1 Tax=Kiloniella sp. GXU_MW_B19 TaxID=3141326 RepID=UPI0031D631D8
MRFLYIEDHPINAKLMRGFVESIWGLDLDVAETAEEGLARIGETDYDLVFIDINLPGKSGLDVIHVIRGNDNLKGLPLIVVSADTTRSLVSEVHNLGVAYLSKPIDALRLQTMTEEALLKSGTLH